MPANVVSLINLLPYSPELNPVENFLWHYLRKSALIGRTESTAIMKPYWRWATETWRTVCMDPEKIRSVCAAPYLEKRR